MGLVGIIRLAKVLGCSSVAKKCQEAPSQCPLLKTSSSENMGGGELPRLRGVARVLYFGSHVHSVERVYYRGDTWKIMIRTWRVPSGNLG